MDATPRNPQDLQREALGHKHCRRNRRVSSQPRFIFAIFLIWLKEASDENP
jgi:hypothetical protein